MYLSYRQCIVGKLSPDITCTGVTLKTHALVFDPFAYLYICIFTTVYCIFRIFEVHTGSNNRDDGTGSNNRECGALFCCATLSVRPVCTSNAPDLRCLILCRRPCCLILCRGLYSCLCPCLCCCSCLCCCRLSCLCHCCCMLSLSCLLSVSASLSVFPVCPCSIRCSPAAQLVSASVPCVARQLVSVLVPMPTTAGTADNRATSDTADSKTAVDTTGDETGTDNGAATGKATAATNQI